MPLKRTQIVFVAGLKRPLQREVNLRSPSSLPAAFALARELSACHSEAALVYTQGTRRAWTPQPPSNSAASSPGLLPTPRPTPAGPKTPGPPATAGLPVVRLTDGVKAERNKKGLCWYCDEKYTPAHNCRRRFLLLMGPDDEDSEPEPPPAADLVDDAPIILGDISTMHSLAGSPSPRALKVAGSVNSAVVQVLLDSGSTHNFIHPTVAKRLALVLHPVTPFRVYVGDGDSLRCSYSCPGTPLRLQGHLFDVDLYLLEIHGPDIVLGVQWLQTLGKVSHDYATMTMEFVWKGETIILRGDTVEPRPISYGRLCSLARDAVSCDLYELTTASLDSTVTEDGPALPTDLPPAARSLLQTHARLFGLPSGLPPARVWDHCIHLVPGAKPINVRPYSRKLGPRRRAASTYHKELYAIVEAVQKWRQYLLGREFVIRSDQRSLKELLSQVIQTPDQQFYIRKLMGYTFRIEYKSGSSNKAADALSRRKEEGDAAGVFAAYARPIPSILTDIKRENESTPEIQAIHAGKASPDYTVQDGVLYYKRRLYIGAASPLRAQFLLEFHSTPLSGHQGVERTFRRLADVFYWCNMRRDVRHFVAACTVCQVTKYSTQKPGGLLQPLPVLDRVWESASMDFITGLPPSRGLTVIMVVVDRLSKYAHFGALSPGYDAPKTDGQTEVTNRGLEQYLRAFAHERQQRWSWFLAWAELALNCSHHEALGMSPFQALYGRPPPSLFPTLSIRARTPTIEELLRDRAAMLAELKLQLKKVQQRMRDQANQHRRDVSFAVGDYVLLKLQPYRQHSVARPVSLKLARRYYGPFEVMERIGEVAYHLRPLEGCLIHDVFHVSLLKPFRQEGEGLPHQSLPLEFLGGLPVSRPEAVLAQRTVLVDGSPQDQWLIRWTDGSHGDNTWEPVVELQRHFPNLRLEDKPALNPGGINTDTKPRVNDEDTIATRRSKRHVGPPPDGGRLNGVAYAGTVARIVAVNIAVGSGAAFIIIAVAGRHVVWQLMKVMRFHQWSFLAHMNPKGEKQCQKHSTSSEQTKDAMWDRIEEKFFTAMNKDGSYRTRDQLTSKWSHINRKVRKFFGVYEECARSRRSGTNDADVLRLATTWYQDDRHQGKVPIDLWMILSRSPKWQQLNNPDGGSSKKRSSVDPEVEVDDTIGSSEQMPPFNVADSDDEDPIPRLIRRKKAKSIASGFGGSGSVSVSSRDDIGRAMVEQLRVFNLREEERMKRKDQEMKRKEQEDEIKIMETDLSTLSGFKRMIYEQRQREIKAKYNLP
ncbi:unnamed protein product [Cuscuta campestris]|uniref:Uncharacterized protein n=1 Tax=Cuscuta campestris TaxID=132261 RepID=A0A484NJ66_9ASTE|nr:unnamed protein product [Cuscuta campestris]